MIDGQTLPDSLAGYGMVRRNRDGATPPEASVSTFKRPQHTLSATVIEPATARLQRSQLAVPASNPAFFEKAARSVGAGANPRLFAGEDAVFCECRA